MSHADYIAKCDEDQLIRLVEMANEKLKQIRAAGWVKLWVVSDDFANLGWFAQDSYLQALDFLAKTGAEAAAQNRLGSLESGWRNTVQRKPGNWSRRPRTSLRKNGRRRPAVNRTSRLPGRFGALFSWPPPRYQC